MDTGIADVVERQLQVVMRGVVKCVDEHELKGKLARSLASKRPLRIKLGVDPTAPDIHLGHTVVLRKLRQFQDLGHCAVLIIGSGTAMVGDPTGKDRTRPTLTADEVDRNAASYLEQAGKIIDLQRTEIQKNGDWFRAMGFFDFVKLAARMTVARMLERDLFQTRLREGNPISIHEFIYPLMQGWDSVKVRADVELGGTDQLFNLLVGRDLMREEGMEPQVCLTTPLLEGLDGTAKMSKSLGNYVGVDFEPSDMFGKIMSIPDALMEKYLLLLTDKSVSEIETLVHRTHPKEAKKRLARAVTASFHGEPAGAAAEEAFERVFRDRELPESIERVVIAADQLDDGNIWVVRLLVSLGFAKSNGEARRLIEGGGVRVGQEKVTDVELRVPLDEPVLVQAGKRRFAYAVAASS